MRGNMERKQGAYGQGLVDMTKDEITEDNMMLPAVDGSSWVSLKSLKESLTSESAKRAYLEKNPWAKQYVS